MVKSYNKIEWTEENKKKFWDYESQFNGRFFSFQVGDVLIELLSKYFENVKNVLDYGSGRGHLLKHLIEKNFQVSALEFSDQAVSFLKEAYSNTKGFKRAYHVSEINKIDNKFDLLFFVETIEHLNDNELQKTMINIKNLLREDGIVVITTPHEERLKESMVCCPECEKTFHRWQHIRSWNKSTLSKYLEDNDFVIKDIYPCDLNYEKLKLKFNLRQKIADWLTKKEREWVYKPHLICIAKKK